MNNEPKPGPEQDTLSGHSPTGRLSPALCAASSSGGRITLGDYLAAVRKAKDMTLRHVEDATSKEVSNAYLSQIENNKIQKPSPNILHALAQLYGVSYEGLMERAGYITSARGEAERHGRAATFADMALTEQEEAELLRYLKFIRSEKESS